MPSCPRARGTGRWGEQQASAARLTRPAPCGCTPPAGPAGLRRPVAPHCSRAAVATREPFGPFDSFLFYRKMAIRVVGVPIRVAQELVALSQYRHFATNKSTEEALKRPVPWKKPAQSAKDAQLGSPVVSGHGKISKIKEEHGQRARLVDPPSRAEGQPWGACSVVVHIE
jgi:hypothetical protein